MSLKGKALELYEDYLNILINYIDNEFERKRIAKECALKTVDNIKEAVRHAYDEEILGIHMIYWEKVKKEIENI